MRQQEADHQLSLQLGGRSTPVVSKQEQRKRQREALAKLPLVADLHGLILDNHVPRTRADCPDLTRRPCGHVKCRYNLLRDEQPQGRPGLAFVPRDRLGRAMRAVGDLSTGQHCNQPKLDAAAWCCTTMRPSCALALAEVAVRRGRGLTNRELGDAMGRHRTLEAILVKRALRSFIRAGGTLEGLRALQLESQTK